MSLRHGWGWQPLWTASHIHLRHKQSVWAHWYAVHGHVAVASNSYTHTTWVRLWGAGSLVESTWCHYVMVEAASHLKLLCTSILDIKKVFENIDMLSMGIQEQPKKQLYLHYLGQILDSGSLVESKWWRVMSLLRLNANSNCYLHPYYTYTKCLSLLICCSWAYGSSLK